MANRSSSEPAWKKYSFRFLISPNNEEQLNNYSGSGSGGGNFFALDSSQPPSESATVIADNEHLLSQILIKLPPKPLLRFQCVSKAWLSLISDPAFRRRWSIIRRNTGAVSLLFFPFGVKDIGVIFIGSEGAVSPGLFDSNPMKGFIKDEIDVHVHSCNGLWCIQLGQSFERISIVVCNRTWQHR
ncbi:OLC1v1036811C1 [Oldenlandia corymbosa var. corymbosa]|uniref:OLC1v1036811C1 n=1 Tax=Oldenlandia corymbosa var. corymbosa TaxID=529605 RepID=A0AAV1CX36_OLDCO|nr:OLC1v1036811C1 [Oldenlandia corymbosa var. corymbosa]